MHTTCCLVDLGSMIDVWCMMATKHLFFSKDDHMVVLTLLKLILELDSKEEESSVLLNKVEFEKMVKNGL